MAVSREDVQEEVSCVVVEVAAALVSFCRLSWASCVVEEVLMSLRPCLGWGSGRGGKLKLSWGDVGKTEGDVVE